MDMNSEVIRQSRRFHQAGVSVPVLVIAMAVARLCRAVARGEMSERDARSRLDEAANLAIHRISKGQVHHA